MNNSTYLKHFENIIVVVESTVGSICYETGLTLDEVHKLIPPLELDTSNEDQLNIT